MKKSRPIKKIQQEILRILIVLVSIMTILISIISIVANVKSESKRIDQNLENIAQAIARSQIVQEEIAFDNTQHHGHKAENNADPMGNGIGEFFAQGVFRNRNAMTRLDRLIRHRISASNKIKLLYFTRR